MPNSTIRPILALLLCASAARAQSLPAGWSETLKRAAPLPRHLETSHIFAGVPWVDVGPGMRRQAVFTDRLTVVRFQIRGGAGKPHDLKHWHPHDQITHITRGEAEVVVGKEVRRVRAGDFYACQSNVPHSLRPLSDTVELLDAFTPVRDDFRGGQPLRPSSAASRPLGENELRAFVYEWFALFDRNAPVAEFIPLLAAEGLWMKFPERTLKGTADFLDWYAGVLENIESASHELVAVQVKPRGLTAEIVPTVVWRATTRKGEKIVMRVRQRWLVGRSSVTGKPVIHSYDVKVL